MAEESLLNRNNLPINTESLFDLTDNTSPTTKGPQGTEPPTSGLDILMAQEVDKQNSYNPNRTRFLDNPQMVPLTVDMDDLSNVMGKPMGIDIYNQDTQQYLPGLYQSNAKRFGNFVGSLLVNVGAEFLNVGAFYAGNIEAVTDGIDEGRQFLIDEYFPTFTTESYATQDQSLLQKLGDAEFWNNEFNETLAFMVGALISRGATARLKLGAKLSKFGVSMQKVKNADKLTRLEKAKTAVGKGLQKYESTFDKVIDVGSQSYYEATAESNGLVRELKDYYEPLIASGEFTKEQATERINAASSGAFWWNFGLLTIPNAVTSYMIPKATKIFKKTSDLSPGSLSSKHTRKIVDKSFKLLDKPINPNKYVTFGKAIGGGSLGYVSEGTQEVLQNAISNVFTTLGQSEYADASNLAEEFQFIAQDLAAKIGTNEFSTAFHLGGILGGMTGGVAEAGSYVKDINRAEALRTNLLKQYKAGADIIQQVAKVDGDGNFEFRKDGSLKLDMGKLSELAATNSMQVIDAIAIQEYIDKGDFAKAERLFLSRVLAPLVYQHAELADGKEIFMANINSLLKEVGELSVESVMPTKYGHGIEAYYDLVKAEYDYMQGEGGDIISNNLQNLKEDKGLLKNTVEYLTRTDFSKDLNRAEKKILNKKKAEFSERAKYAFTVLGARKRQTEKILNDLQEKITEAEAKLQLATIEEEVKASTEKDLKRDKERQKRLRKELKNLNSEYEKITDPEWYRYSFKKYIKDYEDLYYQTKVEQEKQYNKDQFMKLVRSKNYNFKTDPKKRDYQNFDDTVVFKKDDTFYIGQLNGNAQFVVTKYNKQFEFETQNATNVDWLMIEDDTFFDNVEVLEKENAANFMQRVKIRNLYFSLAEAAQDKFDDQADLIDNKQEEFENLKKSIEDVNQKISKLTTELKNAKIEQASADSINRLTDDIKDLENSLVTLQQQRDNIVNEIKQLERIQEYYGQILSTVETYMAENDDIAYDNLTETVNSEDLLTKRKIIERFFGNEDVKEVFGDLQESPISYEEFNAYNKILDKYNAQQKKVNRILNKGLKAVADAKAYIVSTITENLTNSISDYIRLYQQTYPNRDISFEKIIKDFPKEIQDILNDYKAIGNSQEFYDAVVSRVSADPRAYSTLLDKEKLLVLNNKAETQILRKLRKLQNPAIQKEIDATIKRIKDSTKTLEVAQYYRRTASDLMTDDKLDKLTQQLEAANRETNEILGDVNPELLQFVGDFKEALVAVRNAAYNIYNTLGADRTFIKDKNAMPPHGRDQSETIEDADELFRFRKNTPFTTINGVVQIDRQTGKVKTDANNNVVLRDNQDSINANDYMNTVSADDVAKGIYTLRFVNADQLENEFQTVDKKAPFEGNRKDALYTMIYKNGEPVIYNGEIVFLGVAETETYLRGGKTTLDKESVVTQVFKKKGKAYNIYTYDGVTYDLNIPDDLDKAAAIATPILNEEYDTFRSTVLSNLESGSNQFAAVTRISSGMPVNEFTKDPNTDTYKRKFKKATEVLKGIKQVIISKTGRYQEGSVEQPVQMGMPYVVNQLGQLTRVYRGTLGTQDKAMKETVVKLLGFLGQERNIKTTVGIGKTRFPILSVKDKPGLINMFINWGKSGGPGKDSKHLDVWLTGKNPETRVVNYNLNGRVSAIKLSELVTLNPNGFPSVNYASASVQAFLNFLDLKAANVDVNALQDKKLSKFFALPTNLNYKTKKVSTAKEKYKSYQDYIIQTSEVAIVPDTHSNPQFINRYMAFSRDVENLYQTSDAVPNYRKQTAKTDKQQSTTQAADTTAATADDSNNTGNATVSGDTVVDFQKFPKGSLQVSIPDTVDTSGKTLKNLGFTVEYDFTDTNNPIVKLDSSSPLTKLEIEQLGKLSKEHLADVVKPLLEGVFLEDVLNNGNLSNNFDFEKIEFGKEITPMHEGLFKYEYKGQNWVMQPTGNIVYKLKPDSTQTPADTSSSENEEADTDLNCEGSTGDSKGSKKKPANAQDPDEEHFDI